MGKSAAGAGHRLWEEEEAGAAEGGRSPERPPSTLNHLAAPATGRGGGDGSEREGRGGWCKKPKTSGRK